MIGAVAMTRRTIIGGSSRSVAVGTGFAHRPRRLNHSTWIAPMENQDHSRARGTEATRPTDPMVVATTDPAVLAEAEHQSDWKRHPFATIRLETTQAGSPELLAAASPWTIDLAPPGRFEPPPPTPDPSPTRPEPQPVAEAPAPRPMAPPRSWVPWAVAGAAMLGVVVGYAGVNFLTGSRRRRRPSAT